jgi:deoxyribodipyrimidine photolyase-related protein
MSKILRLVLGDQLNSHHSWFKTVDDSVTYVMMEIRTETDYATHHIQKVVGFFSAMQEFAAELQLQKHHVIYLHLNDDNNLQSFEKNIHYLIEKEAFTLFEYQFPDEYRLDEQLKKLSQSLSIATSVCDSEHFMSSRDELGDFFQGKKTFLMESFYHMMRKKHHILMEGDKPLTGKWNYDGENRKKLPKDHKPTSPLVFQNKVTHIVSEIQKTDIKTIGNIDANNFVWPINRKQSLVLLFCNRMFGPFWELPRCDDAK